MIIDETQAIPAIDIMLHMDEIPMFTNEYIILTMQAIQPTLGHLLDVIKVFGGFGWEIIGFASERGITFALIRNTNYKRKNKAKNKAKRSYSMKLDETQAMPAADILLHSEEIPMFSNGYIVVSDQSIQLKFKNLIHVINLLGDFGWETISISTEQSTLFALARNINVKQNN